MKIEERKGEGARAASKSRTRVIPSEVEDLSRLSLKSPTVAATARSSDVSPVLVVPPNFSLVNNDSTVRSFITPPVHPSHRFLDSLLRCASSIYSDSLWRHTTLRETSPIWLEEKKKKRFPQMRKFDKTIKEEENGKKNAKVYVKNKRARIWRSFFLWFTRKKISLNRDAKYSLKKKKNGNHRNKLIFTAKPHELHSFDPAPTFQK